MEQYDAIIIGSGMGGLTVASLLTKVLKKKVLILEKHSKFGGFTHSFGKMNKWRWDVGIHYVGDMHPKSKVRKVMDFISGNKLEWQKFPDPFQYYIYPDFKFAVPASPKKYQNELVKMFPNEKLALDQYFEDIKTTSNFWNLMQLKENNLIKKIIFKVSKKTELLLKQTSYEYFKKNFKDQKLVALLDSQWGDMGLPPSKSPFYIHAVLVSHYLRGAYYPKGGAHKIAESILSEIKANGGEAQSFAPVKDILFDANLKKATVCRFIEKKKNPDGVTEIVKEVFAPIVISNAGARITYKKWISPVADSKVGTKLEEVPSGLSAINLYIGLKESPQVLDIKGENFWIFSDYDHDKMASSCNEILTGKAAMAFLSFGSVHNPEIQNSTAQIITFIEPSVFEKWKDTQLKNRGEEYNELKNKMAATLIDFVDLHIKGFKDLVEFVEVSTPLSVSHYTDQPFGEIYGLSGTRERYTVLKDLGAKTPIENLYLTGTDVATGGIAGAMFGGVITFAIIAFKELLSLKGLNLLKSEVIFKIRKLVFMK